MKAIQVGLQNCTSQSGIEKVPVIKWEYAQKDAGREQKAFRIYISKEGALIYDSKMVYSRQQNAIEADVPLATHERYEMRIEITDDRGEKEISDPVWFVSGVSKKTDWQGKWISNHTKKPFFVGTEFELRGNVKSAYLSVCGLGQYEAVINGSKIGDSVLDGSWTDYHKKVHYQTYDVTDQLSVGENHISIEVGNGWYIADTSEGRHFYTLNHRYNPFGEYLTCIAQMTIYLMDGSKKHLFTNGDWWAAKSPVTLANIYGSEDFDARIWKGFSELYHRRDKEKAVVLSEHHIPKGVLSPMLYPQVKVKKVYETQHITKQGKDCFVFDLGQNMSGQFEVWVKGKRGQKIKITPAEKIDAEGKIEKTTETWYNYILLGSEEGEVFRPKFSYAAGRWVMVEGVTRDEKDSSLPYILDVKGYFITSSAEDVGSFRCSDKRYGQIHELVKKAVESNLNHVHTDCPSIEKLGWLEPNHLMGPSIMYMKDVDTLWEKIAGDMRDAQYEEGEKDQDTGVIPHEYGAGLIPSIAPRYAKFITDCEEGSFWDIIPWGSSILMAADIQQSFYGNSRVVKENYEAAKKYVDYQYSKYLNYPSIYHCPDKEHFICHGLGDWGIEQNKGESRENIETAFLYKDLCLLSKFARALDHEEDELEYDRKASKVKAAYNEALLKYDESDGLWYYDSYDCKKMKITQANQAIPLFFELVPEDKRESVEKSFVKASRNGRFRSGEIGLRFIFRTLAGLGKNDMIHNMIMQKQHPSYYRFVEKGETTLPEFWRDDARSRNHDMMGQIVEWFYGEAAGITSEDGFKKIQIAPSFISGIEWINCEYHAVTGKILVQYERTADSYHMRIMIPTNTCADIYLPDIFKNTTYTCNHLFVEIIENRCHVTGGTFDFFACNQESLR